MIFSDTLIVKIDLKKFEKILIESGFVQDQIIDIIGSFAESAAILKSVK